MIKIDISGFDKALADVNSLATKAKEDVKIALVDFGNNVATDAKRSRSYGAAIGSNSGAPADEGKLRNSINSVYNASNMTVTITAASDYAAYMEFGTRKFAAQYVATLPQDWKTYAATFKGKGGGNFDAFLKAIMEWVRRKGIGGLQTKSGNVSKSKDSLAAQKSAAYLIAMKILREGVRPQPFLRPAVVAHTPKLISDIKKIFK